MKTVAHGRKKTIHDLYEKQCSLKPALKTMKMDLEWLKIEVQKLTARPQCGTCMPTHVKVVDANVHLPKMPLPQINELDLFEKELDNSMVYNKFVYNLKVLGGRTPAEATRKMLKYIFSNRLSTQLTWFGTAQQNKLCSLKIVSAL